VLRLSGGQTRRFRRDPPGPHALAAALTTPRLANTGADGTWRAAPAARAPRPVPGHRRGRAAGRDLTRQDMIDVLTGGGYPPRRPPAAG
jgi:hypothetical protein